MRQQMMTLMTIAETRSETVESPIRFDSYSLHCFEDTAGSAGEARRRYWYWRLLLLLEMSACLVPSR